MAHWTPQLVSVTGKVGTLVLQRNGIARLHAPGPNRTPPAVKSHFCTLSRQWPFSSIEYKELVQDAPGVARGIGHLTRFCYRAEVHRAAPAVECIVDQRGLLPDPLVVFPSPPAPGASLTLNTGELRQYSETLYLIGLFSASTVPVDNVMYAAELVYDTDGGLIKSTLAAVAGARLVGASYNGDYTWYVGFALTPECIGKVLMYCASMYGIDPVSGLATVYGHFTGGALIAAW